MTHSDNPQQLDSNKIVKTVNRDGFYILNSYISEEKCEQAIEEINQAITTNRSSLWTGFAQADKRLFGIEKESTVALDLLKDPFIQEVLLKLNNAGSLDLTILGARLEAIKGNLGSGEGWHRDRHDMDQFKAILYLSDVNSVNGPFQILSNSHKYLYRLWLHYKHKILLSKTRFHTPEEIQKIESLRTKIFCAPRGTLIIANTRSIHRGMPILENVRYAMTVYNWPKGQFPEHIKKMTLR